jgi:hypothetical protein
MMNERFISNAPDQSLYGQPQVSFRPNDFNSVIWSHGYDIICEKAIRCPCQGDSGSPLPDCQNCHGFGYFFINPTRTKALITGLNRNTQYVQWSPELMGTASITVRDEDKDFLSYFDRVTVEDEYASFTEMLVAKEMIGDEIAVFLSYAPIENGIVAVYIYESSDLPLIKLSASDYEIVPENPYCLRFKTGKVRPEAGVSVLYKHRVEYHIIDLPHEIRASLGKDKKSGQFQILKMPIQAIGRRTHLIDIQRPNYDGGGIIHNDDTDTR